MNQEKVVKLDKHEGQFQYLGRWVDKSTFRAFVYNKYGESTLADSYEKYESLILSGIWFDSKFEIPTDGKKKNAVRSDS
jgi:hypothetical protein